MESTDRVKRVENKGDSLKSKNAQLENSIRVELQAKSELISALSQEKTRCFNLEQTLQNVEQKCVNLTKQLETLELKVREFDGRDGKNPGNLSNPGSCAKCVTLEAENNQSQWQLLQVKEELVKTKNLLKTQISINREYQKEVLITELKI